MLKVESNVFQLHFDEVNDEAQHLPINIEFFHHL